MVFDLNSQEVELLKQKNITFIPGRDYTEDDALAILDEVRDAEVYYSQGEDTDSRHLYSQYAALGDKLFAIIPET